MKPQASAPNTKKREDVVAETDIAPASAPVIKLAKALGVLAITASAVSAEYGSGINYVSVQSLSVYPDVNTSRL